MLVKSSIEQSFSSLVHYLRLEILVAFFYASLIYYLYEHHNLTFLASFDFIPVGFLGTILSVFLAFRNNNAYSRWWEARQLWGDLVNASRMWGSQVLSLPTFQDTDANRALQTELIERHLACVNLIRMQLRGQLDWHRITRFVPTAELKHLKHAIHPTTKLLTGQAQRLRSLYQQGALTDFQMLFMQGTLERILNILGGCERIKNTPFPREYDGFIRCLLWMLIGILPIYFLGIFSSDLSKALMIPMTVVVTLVIGFANKAGEILEDPFENRVHDVPMSALCNTIERDLLQQLGSSKVPEKFPVRDQIVW